MMVIMSYYVIGQSLNSTIVVGVLRAGEIPGSDFFLDVGVMWLCSIVGAAVGAFVIGIPMPWGLYPAVQRRGDQDSFLPLEI